MEEEMYSQDIADAIKCFLTEDGQDFYFNDQCGIFRFGIDVEGLEEKIEYSIEITAEDYIVYMLSPIGADAANERIMAEMAEFVCHVNHGLREGNFDLDMRDGEIRYKCFVDCAGITPTQQMVNNSIAWPFVMLKRYIEGIAEVASGYSTAKQAANKSKGFDIEKILDALALEEGYVRQGSKRRLEAGGSDPDMEEYLQLLNEEIREYERKLGISEEDCEICTDDDLEDWLFDDDDLEEEIVVPKNDRKRIFINFSNHPSAEWEESQRKAAEAYGEIVDMEFPSVDPQEDEHYIAEMAAFYLERILELEPDAVLCQGEFCLVYRLVSLLKANRITVLAACSRRMVETKDGKKVASFQFSRFRPYL